MIESGYYPLGAEFDKNAPYNQVETPEIEVAIKAYQTLTAKEQIITTDYYLEDNEFIRTLDEFDSSALKQIMTPKKILEAIPEIYNELLGNVDSKYLSKLKFISENCSKWTIGDEWVELD